MSGFVDDVSMCWLDKLTQQCFTPKTNVLVSRRVLALSLTTFRNNVYGILTCIISGVDWILRPITWTWRLTEHSLTVSPVNIVLFQHKIVCLCLAKHKTRSSRFSGRLSEAERSQSRDRRTDRLTGNSNNHNTVTFPLQCEQLWRMKCNSRKRNQF